MATEEEAPLLLHPGQADPRQVDRGGESRSAPPTAQRSAPTVTSGGGAFVRPVSGGAGRTARTGVSASRFPPAETSAGDHCLHAVDAAVVAQEDGRVEHVADGGFGWV